MTRSTLKAQFCLSTPAFCGADPKGPAEIRPPSLKGVLRFWWRALRWATPDGSREAIAREESKLFGSTDGQSRVRLRVESGRPPEWRPDKDDQAHGTHYLAGQGLYHFRDKWKRKALSPGSEFTLHLSAPSDLTEAEWDSVVEAVRLLGVLGGIGSRSRKGFGSLTLKDLEVDGCGKGGLVDKVAVTSFLRRTWEARTGATAEPEYTAISHHSRFVITEMSQSSMKHLAALGLDLHRFRGCGRDGKDLTGQQAEQRFRDDAHSVANMKSARAKTPGPRRVVFGLPHNYHFSSGAPEVKINPESKDRRASPLFFHLIENPGNGSLAILGLLRSRFLPEHMGLEAKVKGDKRKLVLPHDLWQPIQEFLDRAAVGGKDGAWKLVEDLRS